MMRRNMSRQIILFFLMYYNAMGNGISWSTCSKTKKHLTWDTSLSILVSLETKISRESLTTVTSRLWLHYCIKFAAKSETFSNEPSDTSHLHMTFIDWALLCEPDIGWPGQNPCLKKKSPNNIFGGYPSTSTVFLTLGLSFTLTLILGNSQFLTTFHIDWISCMY